MKSGFKAGLSVLAVFLLVGVGGVVAQEDKNSEGPDKKKLDAARQQAEAARKAAQEAQQDAAKRDKEFLEALERARLQGTDKEKDAKAVISKSTFADLERERAAILEKYQKAHFDLIRQIRNLESEKQNALAQVEKKMA